MYTGLALGLLIVMQWFLVWECLKMKGTVNEHSHNLQSEVGNLGVLMDEALDFISDNMKSPTINLATGTQTPVDFKEAILSALISRVKMANEHGETQQEERPIHEIDQPQEENESIQHQ